MFGCELQLVCSIYYFTIIFFIYSILNRKIKDLCKKRMQNRKEGKWKLVRPIKCLVKQKKRKRSKLLYLNITRSPLQRPQAKELSIGFHTAVFGVSEIKSCWNYIEYLIYKHTTTSHVLDWITRIVAIVSDFPFRYIGFL